MTLDELTIRLGRALQAQPDIRLAFLFGSSVTHGIANAHDVDVAVRFRRPLSLFEQAAIGAALEADIGSEVDLVDLDGASTLLRWEAVRHGVLLWASDRCEVVELRARVPLEYFDLEPYLERESEGLRRALERSRWSSLKS